MNRYEISYEEEDTDDGDVQSLPTNAGVPWDAQTAATGISVPWSKTVVDVTGASFKINPEKSLLPIAAFVTGKLPSSSKSSVGESSVGDESTFAGSRSEADVNKEIGAVVSVKYFMNDCKDDDDDDDDEDESADDGPSYVLPSSYTGIDTGSDDWSMSDVSMATHNFSVANEATLEEKIGGKPQIQTSHEDPGDDHDFIKMNSSSTSDLANPALSTDLIAAQSSQENTGSSANMSRSIGQKKTSVTGMKFWSHQNPHLSNESLVPSCGEKSLSSTKSRKLWEDVASVSDGNHEPPMVAAPAAQNAAAQTRTEAIEDVVSITESKAPEQSNSAVQTFVNFFGGSFGLNKTTKESALADEQWVCRENNSIGEEDEDIVSYKVDTESRRLQRATSPLTSVSQRHAMDGHSFAVKRGLNMAYGAAPSVLGDDDDESHGDNSTIFSTPLPLYVINSCRGDDAISVPPPEPKNNPSAPIVDDKTHKKSLERPRRSVWIRYAVIVVLLMVVGVIAGASMSIAKTKGTFPSSESNYRLRGEDDTPDIPSLNITATNFTGAVIDTENDSPSPSPFWTSTLSPVFASDTDSPSPKPTGVPTVKPSVAPTLEPTSLPTNATSTTPTQIPTTGVSRAPTIVPSAAPNVSAALFPTVPPTVVPGGATGFQILTTADLRSAVDQYLSGTLDVPINEWDVSLITDFSYLFSTSRNSAAAAFNEDLNNWNTANAISLTGIFSNAKSFNGDISTWDTSQVSTFDRVFDGASSFNGDISEWSTGEATTFFSMFRGASSFNGAIGNWETGNVRTFENMFQEATSFNQELLWTTSSAVDMSRMVRPLPRRLIF